MNKYYIASPRLKWFGGRVRGDAKCPGGGDAKRCDFRLDYRVM